MHVYDKLFTGAFKLQLYSVKTDTLYFTSHAREETSTEHIFILSRRDNVIDFHFSCLS